MKSTKIGIQGGKGSFSEEAANIFAIKHGVKDFEIIYLSVFCKKKTTQN